MPKQFENFGGKELTGDYESKVLKARKARVAFLESKKVSEEGVKGVETVENPNTLISDSKGEAKLVKTGLGDDEIETVEDKSIQELNAEYAAKLDMPYVVEEAKRLYKKEKGVDSKDQKSIYPFLVEAFKKLYANALKKEEIPLFLQKMEEEIEGIKRWVFKDVEKLFKNFDKSFKDLDSEKNFDLAKLKKDDKERIQFKRGQVMYYFNLIETNLNELDEIGYDVSEFKQKLDDLASIVKIVESEYNSDKSKES